MESKLNYFHFYNMSETARRIRVLILVKQGKLAALKDLSSGYTPEAQVAERLERLSHMGQIKEENGRYRIQGKLLLNAALLIEFYKRLLGL